MKCDKCESCDYWDDCLGGFFHFWDFEKKRPKACFMGGFVFVIKIK